MVTAVDMACQGSAYRKCSERTCPTMSVAILSVDECISKRGFGVA